MCGREAYGMFSTARLLRGRTEQNCKTKMWKMEVVLLQFRFLLHSVARVQFCGFLKKNLAKVM